MIAPMPRASLTRSVRFRATHQYQRRDWTAAENRSRFGETSDPHEHEYRLDVTVWGQPDPATGFLVDLAGLDQAIEDVVAPLRGRNLTDAISEAREGRLLTSTEGLAAWFFAQLEGRIPRPALLERVRVAESDELAAEFGAD
jgi:6-pyruvoyltetrahydropterin/6-carboxytetrahydropterin synthase